MSYNPPTNELIKFLTTGVRDSFPTVYNAGNSSVAEKYTKVWAEYYNKIRNFIGIVQPLCTTETADGDGLSAITYWTLNPAPTINDIIFGSAKKAYLLGKAPPTNVLPFEIVITSSTDNYSNWPKLSGVTTPLLYQASLTTIRSIIKGDPYSRPPMVSCCLKASNHSYFSTRWAVNSYLTVGTDTLLIRGSLIDLNGVGVVTSQLPAITTSFPDGNVQRLHTTLVGVR